jgi:hypothetical protein
MDGVLLDTAEATSRVWWSWAEAHWLVPEDVVAFAHGRPAEETARHFLGGDGDSEVVTPTIRVDDWRGRAAWGPGNLGAGLAAGCRGDLRNKIDGHKPDPSGRLADARAADRHG